MKSVWILSGTSLLLTALLTACGGGGGGGSTAIAPAANTAISAMSAPANFSFATLKAQSLSAASVLQAVGGFTSADVTKTYVKVWYLDASGNRQQLAFLSLAAFQTLGASGVSFQVPGDIRSLAVEIYDANATKTGGITI